MSTDQDRSAEIARMRALRRYGVLEAPGAQTDDDVVALAARILGTGMAWIGYVDQDYLRFKASLGLGTLAAVPRHGSLCDTVVQERTSLVVLDAPADDRFAANVYVTGNPGIRFYAGAPLMSADGYAIGALCVADQQPRASFGASDQDALTALAAMVMAQPETREAQLQFHGLLQAVGRVSFRADAEGFLVSLSASWSTLTGRSVPESLHRPLPSFVGAVDTQRVEGVLLDAGEGARQAVDCLLSTADGTTVPVELAVTHLRGAAGEFLGTVGILTDLRDRQRREVQERHDQKLEALGRLSAGIAHEINTPIQFVGDNTRFLATAYEEMLQLILAYRGCMDQSSGALSWEERKERIDAAERDADVEYLTSEVPSAVTQSLQGIERVASLVKAMKAFSYKEAVERTYADLNEAIRTTLTVARNEVKYVADVVLDLQDLPPVLCHVGDLNQVFLNLLVNAADAFEDEGKRGTISISTHVEGEWVVVSVADDAGGIPEEIRSKVFEPFFTTKDVGRGTGQGLALARAVVHEKHGGTIEVLSEVGTGSRFVIRLPIVGPRTAVA